MASLAWWTARALSGPAELDGRWKGLGQSPSFMPACTVTPAARGALCSAARSARAEHEGALQTTLRIKGHDDDVNAVAFMDDSSNLIASGSDDTLLKVRAEQLLSTLLCLFDRLRISCSPLLHRHFRMLSCCCRCLLGKHACQGVPKPPLTISVYRPLLAP